MRESSSTPRRAVTLHLVRHGRTMLNTTDRVQGWSDAVLTPDGEARVSAAARGLRNHRYDAAYSSDSGRAVQTADMILRGNIASERLVLHRDRRLREINCGTYEGDLNQNLWTDVAERLGVTLGQLRETVGTRVYGGHHRRT